MSQKIAHDYWLLELNFYLLANMSSLKNFNDKEDNILVQDKSILNPPEKL